MNRSSASLSGQSLKTGVPSGRAFLLLAFLTLAGCSNSSNNTPIDDSADALIVARSACVAAADLTGSACAAECSRFPGEEEVANCEVACEDQVSTETDLCSAPLQQFDLACEGGGCVTRVSACRDIASQQLAACSESCEASDLHCRTRCQTQGAAEESACGFLPVEVAQGGMSIPLFDSGQPAFLASLLDEVEIGVVEAADRRAETLRSRSIKLWSGTPGSRVSITQLEHDFQFGVPLDIREFEEGDGRLAFYGDIARRSTTLLVAETSLKWRNSEPEQDQFNFDLADRELAWAESMGFDIKAHVLLWGNPPPLSSGSGTPEWLRDLFPEEDLTDDQKAQLRLLIRNRVEAVVGRYSGRIDVWEVTNEMLNPLTDWFVARLGPGIVDDIFRWTREADPGAQLVYNEWINEIFTGLGGPDAPAVRDRVLELKAAGVPIDALGQQGHFAPGLVNVGVDVDLSQRTRVDDYAAALDTLAETGLPIHITEVTFAAPDEPEARAAQAEAIMRIWWGHPLVEEIIFWNFWNPLGPRSNLNLGVYADDNNLTRHGEAMLSLVNDRWRTQVEGTTDSQGMIEVRAVFGKYVAQWDTPDGPVHVLFRVAPGSNTLQVIGVSDDAGE